MAKPTLVLVPGFWEGASVYALVGPKLTELGFGVVSATLRSTGTASPGNPSLKDDVTGLRERIEPLVKRGETVVVVAHSAGGFLSAAAVRGLSVRERAAQGKTGGVATFVFLAAGLWPEGHEHGSLPFMRVEGSRMYCQDPANQLFNDFPAAEAERWMAKLESQPAEGWNATVDYAGWKTVPSVYLCGTRDALLPEALCRQMADMAGSQFKTCDAGHMLPLSRPDVVTDVIREAAEAL